MHQSIPTAPSTSPLPPPPGLLRGIFPPCQSRGWGICKFCTARGPGIANPEPISEYFTRTQFTIRIWLHRRFYWKKKQTGSPVKDRNKLKRVVKVCSRFYACISSLLIKPKLLHSEIGAIDVNQRFLVIESNFCWCYLKNILSYL